MKLKPTAKSEAFLTNGRLIGSPLLRLGDKKYPHAVMQTSMLGEMLLNQALEHVAGWRLANLSKTEMTDDPATGNFYDGFELSRTPTNVSLHPCFESQINKKVEGVFSNLPLTQVEWDERCFYGFNTAYSQLFELGRAFGNYKSPLIDLRIRTGMLSLGLIGLSKWAEWMNTPEEKSKLSIENCLAFAHAPIDTQQGVFRKVKARYNEKKGWMIERKGNDGSFTKSLNQIIADTAETIRQSGVYFGEGALIAENFDAHPDAEKIIKVTFDTFEANREAGEIRYAHVN